MAPGCKQQRSDMEREFWVLRREIACLQAVGDCLLKPSDRGERPAGVAIEPGFVRAKLDEAAIGRGGFGVTPAIAEDPGADAQHHSIATGPRQSASNASERVLAPALVEHRFRKMTIQPGVHGSVTVFALKIGEAGIQPSGGKRR